MSLADAIKSALPLEILGRIAEANSELIFSTVRAGRIGERLANEKSPVVIGFPVSPELADTTCPGQRCRQNLARADGRQKKIGHH